MQVLAMVLSSILRSRVSSLRQTEENQYFFNIVVAEGRLSLLYEQLF
jgi:hypothetical protein